ncbi:MAG: NAD-dependent deacylase [Polyangiaceae bacterium]|nr:NAD-dependent deacylase [Polyangiaceae bacterium]
MRQRFPDARRVVVLTGAGISVASGLRTYRGPRGLWTEDPKLAGELVAGVDPQALWTVARAWRSEVARAQPSAAHRALAAYQSSLAAEGGTCTVVTQNVDGLHERAGTEGVIALHGALSKNRCSRPGCEGQAVASLDDVPAPPPCAACGAPLRPDIVLFEEPLGALEEWSAKKALRDVELFVAIGTSGTVSPASNFVRAAAYAGAHTLLINLDANGGSTFDEVVMGDAEVLVPELFA